MTKKRPHFIREWLPVIVITLIALMMRIVFLKWGFPDEFHKLTYHPDEALQVGAMLRIELSDPDPQFYNYPAGYMNAGSVAIRAASAYGLNIDSTLAEAYLIARLLTALMGVITIPFVYWAGRRLFNHATGIIAALLIAILPLHVVHSHFATVDVPAAMWVAVALAGAAVLTEKPALKYCIITGLTAGLAAGTKYNAGLVLIPVIAAYLLADGRKKTVSQLLDGKMWVILAAFFAGILIASPQILIVPAEYLDKFLFEMWHAGSGHGLVFKDKGPGWLDVLSSLGYGTGVPLLVFGLLSVAFALIRRNRADWILLSFMIPYFLIIAFSEVRFTRYTILLLPPFALLSARLMSDVYQGLKEQAAGSMKLLWTAVCVIIIIYTAVYSLAFLRLFDSPDTRTVAVHWFKENVKQGTTVGLPTVPWFYSPPLSDGTTLLSRNDRYEAMQRSDYRLFAPQNVENEWDIAVIDEYKPKYVVITDYEYEDPFRLRLKPAMEFKKRLDNDYVEVARFSKRVALNGIDFGPAEQLPHDLKYMSPTVKVYRRK